MVQSFSNSQQVLEYLQTRYGAADFKRWQMLRHQWYSYLTYTEAGASEYAFFTTPRGQNSFTIEDTNMTKASSFGQQHFLLKAISTRIKINTWNLADFAGTDVTTLYSDLVNGFAQVGVLEFFINNRKFAEIPSPFLFCPPANGEMERYVEGLTALTLTEGTPNTLLTARTQPPYASQLSREDGLFKLDPHILIEAEQQFEVKISFPTGILAVIGTSITDDTTNPLKVGVILDGLLFRPVQ